MKDLDRKIKEKQKELELLLAERDEEDFIKPSETKQLIEKYYGHCFCFEGYESGSLDMILESIEVDREERTISLGGNFIIYATPDISFLSISGGLYPYGGTLLCKGTLDVEFIPYFPDLDEYEHIYELLDETLSACEIPYENFCQRVEDADETADDMTYVKPLDKLYEEFKEGNKWDYDKVFGKL